MTKKRKRHPHKKLTRPGRASKSKIGRFYRYHRAQIKRIGSWIGVGAAAVAVVVLAVVLLKERGVSMTKDDYVRAARKSLLLGYFDRAVVNYHQAQNADPDDAGVKRETQMASSRLDYAKGGLIERAVGAAMQVLSADSTSAFAHAALAQLYDNLNDLKAVDQHARAVLRFAEANGDTTAAFVATLALASSFRQRDAYDSAHAYGRRAAALAEGIGDLPNLASAEAVMAFSALKLDSLAAAHDVFAGMLTNLGGKYAQIGDLARVGLAEYYCQTGLYDSAISFASPVEDNYQSATPTQTSAHASQVLGKSYRALGDYTTALAKLDRSLAAWHSLGRLADIIDNLNDLALLYYLQRDYFNARKYYMAAGRLAERYDLKKKDQYDADMNLRFLKGLTSQEYLMAGEEGSALSEQYAFR